MDQYRCRVKQSQLLLSSSSLDMDVWWAAATDMKHGADADAER